MTRWWEKSLGLTVTDKKILDYHHKWLNDRLINASQQILRKQYGITGLQDVTMLQTLSMDVQPGEFVQILNVASSHWVTISTIGCKAGTVHVYDSGGKHMSYRNKEQIASLLFTELSIIQIEFMNVQIQYGSSDYGLFAVAFATSLCEGIDPTTCIYCQPNMRRHFLACINNGEMKPFPTARIRRPITKPAKSEEITVHCTCRMPFHEQEAGSEKMIMCFKCREWFHDTCLVKAVPEQYWIPGNRTKWYCTYCEQKLHQK